MGDTGMKEEEDEGSLGGLAFLSKTSGLGGSLKREPEDFLVEEIAEDGTVLEIGKKMELGPEKGRFTRFVLQKRNWSTAMAMSEIGRRLGIGRKSIGFAGSKDRRAITTQLASMQGADKERLLALDIRDIKINGAWGARDKVRLGALAGNRFTIRVEGGKRADEARETVETIASELEGRFPNYFGEQRFGSNARNTHRIGELLIRNRHEEAAMAFLCGEGKEKNEDARLAREELREGRDFTHALKIFPRQLVLERSMLAHLSKKPDDFAGAFRALPRQTLLLFVHAFQSHMFNRLLSDRIMEGGVEMEEGEYLCPVSSIGFPETGSMDVDGWLCMKILGYNSNPNPREKALMEELEITKDDFKLKSMPEIASKGTFRTAFAPLVGFSFDSAKSIFRFSLQSGSYATSALREFMAVDKA